jgi:GT2 family glycosyltransferase
MQAPERLGSTVPAGTAAAAGDRQPGVSIGLPVYNGARHLAEALDSLLAQTYSDFELIISDNASTDETAAICADYARRDPRIRYVRQSQNIGAPRNWSFVATVARGTYFKWASSNDICAADMLERCVTTLSSRPDAVLCYGRTSLMDEDTGQQTPYDGDFSIEDERPSERFKHLLRAIRLNNAQCGLIRTSVLRQTGLDRPYPAGDMPLMGELALRGRFILVPEVLLVRRMGRRTFSRNLVGQAQTTFYGSRSVGVVSTLRKHFDHAIGILRAPIDLEEKRRSFGCLARYLFWEIYGVWRALRTSQNT